jgi:hypothetical protein
MIGTFAWGKKGWYDELIAKAFVFCDFHNKAGRNFLSNPVRLH